MTIITLGFREDSKEEEPEKGKEKEEKEKEKDDKVEDSSDLETKEKEKEREKEKVTLQEMRAIGLRKNGKEMRENWNEGYRAYEDETAWQSQAWDEWQEDCNDDYGYFEGKGKKGKKAKGKGRIIKEQSYSQGFQRELQ